MKRLLIVAVVTLLTACGSSGSKSVGSVPTSTSTAAGATVVAKAIAFTPSTVHVHVGDTVTWEFKDGLVVHNVNGKGAFPDFYSGNPQSSGTYHYTFTKAGTYSYHCDVHPVMVATVVVS